MFSLMQENKTEVLCEQAKEVTFLFHSLKDVLCRLQELDKNWNPEIDEYLREERYLGRDAREFIKDMQGAVRDLKIVTGALMSDHINLCLDLERVGRGESFSV